MAKLEAILAELGIFHYLSDFIEQGFDSWDTILDIMESDFAAIGVKLGHRRKLQRKIADSMGWPGNWALPPHTRNTPYNDRRTREQIIGIAKAEGKKTGTGREPRRAKRRYRRHPKPDQNAPQRPPSAYVLFSNEIRDKIEGRNLSFTERAKLSGEKWSSLSPGEKGSYQGRAFYAKEIYDAELSEYKQTSQYREYLQYLLEFKARHPK
jgi:hypothetical protein